MFLIQQCKYSEFFYSARYLDKQAWSFGQGCVCTQEGALRFWTNKADGYRDGHVQTNYLKALLHCAECGCSYEACTKGKLAAQVLQVRTTKHSKSSSTQGDLQGHYTRS